MKNKKSSREEKKGEVWIISIATLLFITSAITLAILYSWHSKKSEYVTMDSSLKSNTYLTDLSCSGMITEIDGQICFVSNRMYDVRLSGATYKDVNTFYLTDSSYQNWAEQPITVCAAAISRSDEKFNLDLQYIVGDDICISTPFSVYHYPAEWADKLIVIHSYSENYYKVGFYADMNMKQEYLFSITMGKEEGTPIGKLTDNMGAVTMVYLLSRSNEFEDYSPDEENYLHGMMEGVNYLLDELAKNPQFSEEF